MRRTSSRYLAVIGALGLVASGCGDGSATADVSTTADVSSTLTSVSVAADVPASDAGTTPASVAAAGGPCLPSWREGPTELVISTSAGVERVGAADLNGDGRDDAIVARSVFQTRDTYEIDVVVGNEQGGLTRATQDIFSGAIPRVIHPSAILFSDFNGDGVDDVFIADQGLDADPFPGFQNTLVLSVSGGGLVDATGGLPQQWEQTHSAAAADIDLDGDLDLYIGNLGGGGVRPQIWLNDGSGGFTVAQGLLPTETTDLTSNWYTASGFGDVDGDLDPDLILGHGDPGRDSHVLLNDGTGRFSRVPTDLPPTPLGDGDLALDVKASDLNDDGFEDVLLVHTRGSYSGRHIQVLISNGDGTFVDETAARLGQSTSGNWIRYLDLIDLDRDGDHDLVATLLGAPPNFYLNDGNGSFDSWDPGVDLYNFAFVENSDGEWDILNVLDADPGSSSQEIHILMRHSGCRD